MLILMLALLGLTPEGVWHVREYQHGYSCVMVVKPAKRGWSIDMRYNPEVHAPNGDTVWSGLMTRNGDCYLEHSRSKYYPDTIAIGVWQMRNGELVQVSRELRKLPR